MLLGLGSFASHKSSGISSGGKVVQGHTGQTASLGAVRLEGQRDAEMLM